MAVKSLPKTSMAKYALHYYLPFQGPDARQAVLLTHGGGQGGVGQCSRVGCHAPGASEPEIKGSRHVCLSGWGQVSIVLLLVAVHRSDTEAEAASAVWHGMW